LVIAEPPGHDGIVLIGQVPIGSPDGLQVARWHTNITTSARKVVYALLLLDNSPYSVEKYPSIYVKSPHGWWVLD